MTDAANIGQTIGYDTKTKKFTYNTQINKLLHINNYKYLQFSNPTTTVKLKNFLVKNIFMIIMYL